MSDLDTLKKLRESTGVSIMRCREALEEAGGDIEKAKTVLKKEAAKIADKKSDRATESGVIDAYIHGEGKIGVVVEVRTETDFVAKNSEFKKFAHDIAMHIAAMNPENTDELMGQPFIKNQDLTIADYTKEVISKFGENIEIGGFSRLEL